jgi:hypothetical protein
MLRRLSESREGFAPISFHSAGLKEHSPVMMKIKLFVAASLAAVLLGGCVVQSIQPLFSESDSIDYPELVGTWKQQDEDKQVGLWTFSKDGQRYKLMHRDEKGHSAAFNVTAGKIGTNVFLNFSPDDLLPGSELNELVLGHLIPANVFVKAVKTNDALLLLAMDVEWLEKHLEANPKAIAHVLQEKRPIFTASTDDLKAFVARHGNDPKVFKNEIKLVPSKDAK